LGVVSFSLNLNFLFYLFNQIFFPQKCIFNKNHYQGECVCVDDLPIIDSNYSQCARCGFPKLSDFPISFLCGECIKKPPSFDYHRSIFIFKEPIDKTIYGLKYGEQFEVIDFLVQSILKNHQDLICQVDFIIPVPLSKNKLKKRGFNQSLEISKKISKKTKIPVLKNELLKIKDTKDQIDLSKIERRKNLKKAFELRLKTNLKDKKVLLIDDVYTTGATLNECAKILKKYQDCVVYVITIARKV
jgi:ComF family protein